MSELFSRVEQLRLEKALSYRELAQICGVSPQNVQRWKSGGTIMPEHLDKLAVYFGVSVDYLLTGRESVSTKLVYGMREMLFEAKGATGLSVQELAEKMGVDVREVERVMNEGGGASIELTEAFEEHLIPLIKAVRDKHFSTGKNSAPSARAPSAAPPGAACTACAAKDIEALRKRVDMLEAAFKLIPKGNHETH